MKPRNREINIFNMSLLDILCGALGAFCFLMLVLFPYYSQDKGASAKAPEMPPAADPKSYQEALDRVKQLEDTLKKFQNYADQTGARAKRLEAQNRELQNDIKMARDRNNQLELRKPLLAIGRFIVSDADFVQVYVEDDRVGGNGHKNERLDPSKAQNSIFTGDYDVFGEGAGLSYFMVRDTPAGEYRVFAKIVKHQPSDPPIHGYVTVQVDGKFEVSPTIYATKAHTAIPIALVTSDADHKQTFRMVVPKDATVPPQGSEPQKK